MASIIRRKVLGEMMTPWGGDERTIKQAQKLLTKLGGPTLVPGTMAG